MFYYLQIMIWFTNKLKKLHVLLSYMIIKHQFIIDHQLWIYCTLNWLRFETNHDDIYRGGVN